MRLVGSPPRAWGQSVHWYDVPRNQRFTPTGVGTMLVQAHGENLATVHPHGRGDNLNWRKRAQAGFGSPPRAWGQSASACTTRTCTRFTPTGVGTINSHAQRAYTHPVHPHGRGDNNRARLGVIQSPGSPPRAWGQSCRWGRRTSYRRFTPTGVGTITKPPRVCSEGTVHPHGRGDNSQCRSSAIRIHGSPPRAWGQLPERDLITGASRFTPTGVGTMPRVGGKSFARTVHPHGRGDNGPLRPPHSSSRGSPPRAWGQCSRADARRRICRFTPTGVGTIRP